MIELWLNFKDEKGEDQRVLVEGEIFTVGRHSSNDLVIPNSKLSREHIKINRFAGVLVVSECGSSNGTTINGQDLKDPVILKNSDEINLGGGVDMLIEIVSDDPNAAPPGANGGGSDNDAGENEAPGTAAAGTTGGASPDGGSGIPTSVFYIAPIFGVIILVFLGGIIYLASSGDAAKPPKDDEFVYSTNKDNSDPDPDRPAKKHDDPPSNQDGTDNPPPANSGPPINADPSSSPAAVNLTDSAKCEQDGGAFLRQIAQNEPKAFLTGAQAQLINAKIKQISTSSAIVDNINSARKSSSQIKAIAAQKNLKPQLLAAAALTALGTTRGDVLQKAQSMADNLDKLGTQIGSELANDSLLMIAAYDQGA
ncbi:MAG: FHA domain-containing protein, partial [Pyrinomonadaceae bacterium]